MTMSLRRPGMASPALAVLAEFASRRSLFFFRARAFLPGIALEALEECACRVRVVVRRAPEADYDMPRVT